MEFKLFPSKNESLAFIQKYSFFNSLNDSYYDIIPRDTAPKRFIGQYFVAIVIIENPGQIDCRDLNIHFIFENEHTSGSLEFLHNFEVPYLMKNSVLIFPINIYLQQQNYKYPSQDSRQESLTWMFGLNYPTNSTRRPTLFRPETLSRSATKCWTMTSSITISACRI
jgi:hypothetical protein